MVNVPDPILIPFKAEHLIGLTNRDTNIEPIDFVQRENGPAFTAIVDGKIIGCCGIIIQWQGMGSAWAIFTDRVAMYPMFMTRMIRRGLRDIIKAYDLHRVELVALADNERNQRWAELLGFSPENGKAHKYTPTKRDVIRYEFVR